MSFPRTGVRRGLHPALVAAARAVAVGAAHRIRPERVRARVVEVWKPAYIGIGSNVDGPRAQVRRAIETLGSVRGTRVIAASPLYGSKPFGPVVQADFVNAVVAALTQLDARSLHAEMRAIELALGRPPVHEKWGPRVIDLDLLVYARERRADPDLVIPHPGIVERNFVLYPLADLAPDLDVPGLGRVAGLKERVPAEGVWRLS
jgi:2-amino-4-hydroxy-6-hydroxymethyldihydropteridine diphosphokinase